MTDEKDPRNMYEVFDHRHTFWVAAETHLEALELAFVGRDGISLDGETPITIRRIDDDETVLDLDADPQAMVSCREWAERAGKSCVVLTEDW